MSFLKSLFWVGIMFIWHSLVRNNVKFCAPFGAESTHWLTRQALWFMCHILKCKVFTIPSGSIPHKGCDGSGSRLRSSCSELSVVTESHSLSIESLFPFSNCKSETFSASTCLLDSGFSCFSDSNPLPSFVAVLPSSKMMSSGLGAFGRNSSPGHICSKMALAYKWIAIGH